MRKILAVAIAVFVAAFSAVAMADLAVLDGAGDPQTIKNFVCETTKLCNSTVLIKSDGTEVGTISAPMQVTVSNTNANGQAALANSSPVALAKNSGTGATVAGAAVGTAGTPSAEVVTTQSPASDPCQTEAPTYTPVSISASGSAKIITGVSAKKVYICQINLVTNAANNVALTEGTGTNCGTSKAGIIGGTTASSGWNFSANGGISIGHGGYSVLAAATNADDVCLDPSASTQLSGMVKWVAR